MELILAFALVAATGQLLADKKDYTCTPSHRHLGDGINSCHYFPFVNTVKKSLESRKEAFEIAQEQARVDAHNLEIERHNAVSKKKRTDILKPPIANIRESEVSHLLAAIVQFNHLQGAAIFSKAGLKIAETGSEFSPVVLNSTLWKALLKLGPEQGAIIISCRKFKAHGLVELKTCKAESAIFLPVFDYATGDAKLVGFSGVLADRDNYPIK